MESINVSIRVRPLSSAERPEGSPWVVRDNTIVLQEPSLGIPQDFKFDNVFDERTSTEQIFQTRAVEIARSVVDGFNGTIFAYGQTSSGKTHTMRGDPDAPGVIPLCINEVFHAASLSQGREFLLRVSYLEIYNEEINDLLCPDNRKLQVHESLERGIFVAGLREEIVMDPGDVLALLAAGEENRSIGETKMNQRSSRSHTIFRMVVESRELPDDEDEDGNPVAVEPNCEAVRVATLNLVDLAGSERVSKTGAEGVRLKEGGHINKSLMTLGTVIKKLSEGVDRNGGHIPFRDSKLTRILQPALGGNTKTSIICCITPAKRHEDESLGSLRFAQRAKQITNVVTVNEILDDKALLKRQRKEIEELRRQLEGSGNPHLAEEIIKLRNALLQVETEKDLMAAELQESRQVQEDSLRRMHEQERKLDRIKSLMLSNAAQQQGLGQKQAERGRNRKGNRRETWCPPAGGIGPSLLASDVSPPAPDSSRQRARWLEATLEEEEEEEEELGEERTVEERRIQRSESDAYLKGLFKSSVSAENPEGSSGRPTQADDTPNRAQEFLRALGDGNISRRQRSLGEASSSVSFTELQEKVSILCAEREELLEKVARLEAAEEQLMEQEDQLNALRQHAMELEVDLESAVQQAWEKGKEEERSGWYQEKMKMTLELEENKTNITRAEEELIDVWGDVKNKETAIAALQTEKDSLLKQLSLANKVESSADATTAASVHLAEFEGILAQWRKEGKSTSDQASELQWELPSLTEQLKNLIQENKELKAQHQAQIGTVTKNEEKIDDLQDLQSTMTEKLAEMRAENESLQKQIQEGQSALKELKEEMETKLEQAGRERHDIERAMSNAQSAIQDSDSVLENLSADRDAAREEAAEAKKAANTLEHEKVKLERMLQDANKAMEEATTKAKEARQQKVEGEQRVEALTRESQQARSQAAQSLQKQEEKAKHAQEELAELRKDMAVLKKQLAGSSARPAALEKEKETLSREVEKSKTKIQDLEAKLKNAAADKATLKAEIAKLEKEVRTLRGQSSLLTREVSKKENNTEKQKGAMAEKDKLLVEKIEEVQEQATQIETLEEDLAEAREKCMHLQSQVDDLSAELGREKSTNSQIHSQVEDLNGQVEELRQFKRDLEAQVALTELELKEVQQQHAQLRSEFDEASEAMNRSELEWGEKQALWEDKEKRLDVKIKQLADEVQDLQNLLDTQEASAREKIKEVQKRHQEKLAEKADSLTAAMREKEGKEEEMKELRAKHASTLAAREKAEKKMEQLMHDLSTSRQDLRCAEEEARGLREDLNAAQRKLEDAKAKLMREQAKGDEDLEDVRMQCERAVEEQRQLSEEVLRLHSKLQQATAALEKAEAERHRAEQNALIAQEEVERLQETLQSTQEQSDSQADNLSNLGHKLLLAEERARALEDQVEEMELQQRVHMGFPGGPHNPLGRTTSKGVEAALRMRIETLEKELKEVYSLRESEQEVWKAHTVDRKRRIDGLTERLTCSEEQRMQLERVVKLTQREKLREAQGSEVDLATKEKELVETVLKVQEQGRKAVYHLDRLNKKYASLQVQYDQLLLQLQNIQGSQEGPDMGSARQQPRPSPLAASPVGRRSSQGARGEASPQGKSNLKHTPQNLADILTNKENMIALRQGQE